jgi:hypothetical protein
MFVWNIISLLTLIIGIFLLIIPFLQYSYSRKISDILNIWDFSIFLIIISSLLGLFTGAFYYPLISIIILAIYAIIIVFKKSKPQKELIVKL